MGSAAMWADVLGCLRAVVAFAAVLVAPGYCLGWWTDVLGFRGRPANQRLGWAVALSFGGMPIVAVLGGKFLGLRAVELGAVTCSVMGLGLAGWQRWGGRGGKARPAAGDRYPAGAGLGFRRHWPVWLGLAWVAFAVGELVDVGVGSRLWLSVTVFDHALRTAFVDAAMRTGVPPANPLFWPGHAAPMRYYYFWYVLTAVAAKLGGATARQGLIASVVWAGFGLAAVVVLFCKEFLGGTKAGGSSGGPHLQGERWDAHGGGQWVGLGLLGVTGLDVLPAAAKALLRLPMDADMEWWSPDQVTSWLGSVLWVPHHVAGLVCCLVGFLLVWRSRGETVRQRVVAGVLAGVAFASALGLSTWVAIAFAGVMTVWAAWVLVWERGSRGRVVVLVGAATVAVIVSMPYLAELRGEASGMVTVAGGGADAGAGAGDLLRFGVRRMIDPEAMQGLPGFAGLAARSPRLEDKIAGLVLLGPGYFVELGFFGAVMVVAVWRWRRLGEAGRTATVLAVAGLVVATFVRSTVVANNDFGIRSILIAQFFLLLLGVMWWREEEGLGRGGAFPRHAVRHPSGGRWGRALMLAMLWVGVAGTVYQAAELRVYLPVQERLGRVAQDGLGEKALAVERGFAAMRERTRANAVVQFDTTGADEYFGYAKVMYAGRQMADGLAMCPAAFGGEATACAGVEGAVKLLFGAGVSAAEARDECGRTGIQLLAATRWDGIWQQKQSWVWGLPVVVQTGEMRVLDCSAAIR